MIFTFDIDPKRLDDWRALLEHHRVTVQEFEEEGPAGGCPRFTVLVDSGSAAQAIIEFYFG